MSIGLDIFSSTKIQHSVSELEVALFQLVWNCLIQFFL
jgi:hypothetical protein